MCVIEEERERARESLIKDVRDVSKKSSRTNPRPTLNGKPGGRNPLLNISFHTDSPCRMKMIRFFFVLSLFNTMSGSGIPLDMPFFSELTTNCIVPQRYNFAFHARSPGTDVRKCSSEMSVTINDDVWINVKPQRSHTIINTKEPNVNRIPFMIDIFSF
jgi:hypothetical protein